MEATKTSKTDLESKRIIFREVGFIVALVMLFCAFESKTYQEEVTEIILPTEAAEVEEVLPVFVPRKAARPLPRVTQMPLLEVLEVVDDEMSLESEVELNSNIVSPVEGSENGTGDWVSTGFEGDERGEDDVFIVVEENPRFKGDLQRWLQKNLRYPMMAVENEVPDDGRGKSHRGEGVREFHRGEGREHLERGGAEVGGPGAGGGGGARGEGHAAMGTGTATEQGGAGEVHAADCIPVTMNIQ